MSYFQTLECLECGETFSPQKVQTYCKECESPLLARYDLEKVDRNLRKEDLFRRNPTMWRYRELLPASYAKNTVTLGEGMTPIHELNTLGEKLGLQNLYMKDDGVIPTGTFKARGLAMAVSKAKELGIQRVAIPSAGNAAGALSTYGARAGMEVVAVMPKDAPAASKVESVMAGAKVYLVDGAISEAGRIIQEGKQRFNWFDISTTKEPYRVEGKKTMGLELAEQFDWDLPDVIFYPTGGGTGVIGMWKAFQELAEMGWIDRDFPRMVVVQSQGCAPLVEAFQSGNRSSKPWEDPETLAGGIRVPKAFGDFLVMDAVYQSDGRAVSVSDQDILDSAETLAQHGVYTCPEGAATLSGLQVLKEDGLVQEDEKILLYNTGAGIKYTQKHKAFLDFDLPVINSAEKIDL